jgi:hypothetical protein
MAIPSFWNTPFRYLEVLAVVDVSTIIANVSNELVAAGWWDCSGIGTGPWTSPARADGVGMKIAMARISATRLQVQFYDGNGMLVSNSTHGYQDIDATGSPVHIYSGPFHFAVNTARATPECNWACVLDPWPEPINLPRPMVICGRGPRNNSGTWQNASWRDCRVLPPGGTAYGDYTSGIMRVPPVNGRQYTFSGTILYHPVEHGRATDSQFYGRVPQAILIPDAVGWGGELTAPLDGSTNGVFKAVGTYVDYYQKLAFRKS